MDLEKVFPQRICIILNGTSEEKGLRKLSKEVQKMSKELHVGNPPKEWDKFDKRLDKLKGSVNLYSGKYENYFKQAIKNIENEKKMALGYNLHEYR